MKLLKRFVCGRCSATGPAPEPIPFILCASCGAVGDFDWGRARNHPDWHAHDALLYGLLSRNKVDLDQAKTDANRKGYAAIYERVLHEVIARFPVLYPKRIAEPTYLAQYIALETQFQTAMAIEPLLLDAQLEYDQRKARVKPGKPSTLWPLVDQALLLAEAQERLCHDAVPPDDFAPQYFRRIGISAVIADWMQGLSLADQRALVKRMGVEVEYVEPHATQTFRCGGCGSETQMWENAERIPCASCHAILDVKRGVDCRNCGATILMVHNVEQAACPFCHADMREVEGGAAERAAALAVYAEYDRYLQFVRDAANGAPVKKLEILDGPITRKGKPYRMITLRSLCGKRREDFWEMFDSAGSKLFDELYAWVSMVERERGVPCERHPYREHPRCNEVPETVEELVRRLADVAPGHKPEVVIHRDGFVCEVVVDGTVVRLAADPRGVHSGVMKKLVNRR